MNDIHMLNFHFSNENFGAVMVPYSLKRVLNNFSLEAQCINFIPDGYNVTHNQFDKFRKEFLNVGPRVSTFCSLRTEYSSVDKILVGSDQVFRQGIDSPYFCEWVVGKKLVFSYAASFAVSSFVGCNNSKEKKKYLLSRFDAHSVRESSGVDIMKNTFGLDAVQVLDPTLLLNSEDYQPIIDSEECSQPEKYVGVMFLDDEHWEEFRASALYRRLSRDYEIVDIVKDEQGEFRSVPQWLSYIKHASLMITDSFHGTVFSTIYKKQFITRATASRGNARLESLCRTLDIPLSRFYARFDEKDDTQFDTPLDFTPVWKRIEEERLVSLDYLTRSLAMEPKEKEFIPFRRDKLALPVLTIEEREHEKRLLLFGCLPVVSKPDKGNTLYLFGKIPFSREAVAAIKRKILGR